MNLLFNISETSLLISGELWIAFLGRLFAYIFSLFVLIRYIYYPHNGQSKFLFILFLTGLMIFLIASTLDQVTLNIGIALGLFAIFGIIRYRTPSIELKEITYLFLAIGMAVINALVDFNVANWVGLFICNSIILGASLIMERYQPKSIVLKKMLIFNPTSFKDVNNEELLIQDINEYTGIDVFKIEIAKINKSKNEISVWIYFRSSKNKVETMLDNNETENDYPESSNHYNWDSTYSDNF